MKRLLSILGAITLILTSTTSLVACNISLQYTEEELKELKGKNNIKTKDGILEWIVPQEKPFKKVDNKYYVTIWRTTKEDKWKISLFKFINKNITNIDSYDKYILQYSIKQGYNSGLMLVEERDRGRNVLIKRWEDDSKQQELFKSLYKWDDDKSTLALPKIDENGNIIV